MSESLTTVALLGRTVDYGDADRICTFLTEDLGRISAIAKNARRSRKRFGAALSLFVLARVSVQRKRGDVYLLQSLDCVQDLGPKISTDVIAVAHGSYIIELAQELWPADQVDRPLFGLVLEALRELAAGGPNPALLRAYELQALGLTGFVPATEFCAQCGTRVGPTDSIGFSVTDGGLICGDCGPRGYPISFDVAQRLKLLRNIPFSELGQTSGSDTDLEHAHELRRLMMMVVRHQLGKELRSLDFIAQLAR